MARPGRPKKVQPEQMPVLREIVNETPLATLTEIRDRFFASTGIPLYIGTLRKVLQEAGITRHRGAPCESAVQGGPTTKPKSPARLCYQDRHRKEAEEQHYPGCLTDAEWGLVADIFDVGGSRGTPPHYSRRLLVDACCYVVRNSCSWRMLPQDFPPWQNVYRTFRRWSKQGKFEQMNDRLRAQWREREGRNSS